MIKNYKLLLTDWTKTPSALYGQQYQDQYISTHYVEHSVYKHLIKYTILIVLPVALNVGYRNIKFTHG